MFKIKCAICGKSFDSTKSHTRYCQNCKRMANVENNRKYRARIRAKKYKDAQESREESRVQIEKRIEEQRTARWLEIERKASKGDNYALMKLALKNADMFHYWMYYRECIIENDNKYNKKSNHIIGTMNIYDEGFEDYIRAICEKC